MGELDWFTAQLSSFRKAVDEYKLIGIAQESMHPLLNGANASESHLEGNIFMCQS